MCVTPGSAVLPGDKVERLTKIPSAQELANINHISVNIIILYDMYSNR